MRQIGILAIAIGLGAMLAGAAVGDSGGGYGGSSDDDLRGASNLKKGEIYVGKKQYERAIGALKRHLHEEPDSADAWNLMGFSQRKLERYAKAEQSYGRALEIDPDHKGALEYRGELYLETQRPDEARAALERLERLCPSGCDELAKLEAAFDDAGVPQAASAE